MKFPYCGMPQKRSNWETLKILPPFFQPFLNPTQRRKPPLGANHHLQPIRVESLSQRLAQLTLPRVEGMYVGKRVEIFFPPRATFFFILGDQPPENIVDVLPPEVLMVIFSYLDDISLYAVGNVCRRYDGKRDKLFFVSRGS